MREIIEPLLTEGLRCYAVGSIPEIFDAEPPYAPNGCVAQAWSVSELLRTLRRHLLTRLGWGEYRVKLISCALHKRPANEFAPAKTAVRLRGLLNPRRRVTVLVAANSFARFMRNVS